MINSKYLITISLCIIGITYFAFADSKTPLQECQEAYMLATNELYRYNENHSRYKVSLPEYDCNETKISATGSDSPVPPKWYSKKHSLNLSGSHDYTAYDHRNGAVWKTNNPSWLTWWVSNTLKWLWKTHWIKYNKGIKRPPNEWWYYIEFPTIEYWLRAKVIAIRERWANATVNHFLAGWGTDHLDLSFDKNKLVKDLNEYEFAELFIQQLKKESPWLVTQLVSDWILIVD